MGYYLFKGVISASISFIDGSRLRMVLGSRVIVRCGPLDDRGD